MNTQSYRHNDVQLRTHDVGTIPNKLSKGLKVVRTAETATTSPSKSVASQQTSNSHVYVHSKDHAWVPASLVKTEGKEATVVIQKYKDEEEMLSNFPKGGKGRNPNIQVVKLKEYENGVLPLQNVDDGGKLREYEDMVNLPYLHEAAILYNLKYRHYKGKPYTRTGDIVIAINPYKWYNELYTEKKRESYASKLIWEKSDSDPREFVEPHVYEVSALSYKGMAYDNENQSILVSGESGAGKTETVKICMNHIATVQRGPAAVDEKSHIVQKILDSNPLLEAFGNAKTRRNDNSSRFGKFIQLQFDKSHNIQSSTAASLAGSKCDVYLLEKNRVVSHDSEERTYHIFYQLLAAPEEEKSRIWKRLSGTTNESFNYVGRTNTNTIEGVNDHDRFMLTKNTLELIGIKGDKFRALMQAICIVLQLGNITFAQDANDDDKSSVAPASQNQLTGLAELMGLLESDLVEAFTLRTMKTRDETYKVPQNPNEAKDSCNGFAKEIYGRIFLWLVDTINKATCAEENYQGGGITDYSLIGLLDIFGFESFGVNRFEQLCINYANEKLQHKFTEDIFRSVEKEYKEEGIPLAEITYDDNTDVLDLIEGRTGLLAMLNEECVRPKGNASGFVFKALQQNKRSPCLIRNNMDRLNFGIQHFAGKVMYDAEDFVTGNLDRLPADLLECGTKCSNNSILANVFVDESPNPEPRGRTVKRKQKSVLMCPTVWTKYKEQLSKLMVNLRQTQTRYIRCIKPNTVKKPNIMEHNITVEQLRSAGIVAGVTISRAAFPNRLPNKVVYMRYNGMWDRRKFPSSSNGQDSKLQQDCRACLSCALKPKEVIEDDGRTVQAFVVGKTRTYFRSGALEYLESKRLKGLDTQAITIQRFARGWLVRKKTQDAVKARQKAALEEKARREKQAREEKARRERLAKEAEERRREREKVVSAYKKQIDDLKQRIQEAKEEKSRVLRPLLEQTKRAKQQQEEVKQNMKSSEADFLKEKELIDRKMSEYRKKYEANKNTINKLKKDRKGLKKQCSKSNKQCKRLSTNNEKLRNSEAMNSVDGFSGAGNDAADAFETNEELQRELSDHQREHKRLSTIVDEKQEEYLARANERLQVQKGLNNILELIIDECKNYKLCNGTQEIAHTCEAEAKARMEILEAQYE